MTISVAKEANASAGDNQACSNGRNREDECGGCEGCGARGWDSSKKGSLLLWRWIGAGIAMLAGDSGTWPVTVEIGGREEE